MLSIVSPTPTRLQTTRRAVTAAAAASMTRRIQTPTVAITRKNRQQRTLSTNIMSTPIPAPAPVGIMSMKPPRVVSRRAWQQYQQRHGNGNNKDSTNAKKTAPAPPEKPWPASVRYTAYAAAVTVIPYMTAWIVSYNPSLRSLVFKEPESELDDQEKRNKSNNSKLEDYLRWQFGTEDEEEAKTTTRHEHEDENAIPKQFPNEWPYSIRRAQAAIRALERDKIFVRIGILTNDGNSEQHTHQTAAAAGAITDGMSGPYSLGDLQQLNDAAYYYHLLPGSTPARIDAIVNSMKSSVSTTTSDNRASRGGPFPPPFLSSVSLDFEDVSSPAPPTLPQTKTSDDEAVDNDNDDDKAMMQQSTLANKKQQQRNDPLLKQVSCFSLWHYQDAAILQAQVQAKQEQRQQQNASSSMNKKNNDNSNDSIELARLEYQVQQFQNELDNAASSLRAVDDIRHDLQESKAALTRLRNRGGGGGSWWSLW